MPLLDHFHPPVSDLVQWNSFHSNWATRIADQLTDNLPAGFRAEEHVKLSGGVEIDVGSYRRGTNDLTDIERDSWAPPSPTSRVSVDYPDQFEVRVIQTGGGHPIVAAVELVSPSNKDRPTEREAFAAKVCSYILSGICVIVVDVVTVRRSNLHNEIVRILDLPAEQRLPVETELYAVTYRPALLQTKSILDVWQQTFAIGDPLPTMPLRLTGELFVPVDFESAYEEACRRRKLLG